MHVLGAVEVYPLGDVDHVAQDVAVLQAAAVDLGEDIGDHRPFRRAAQASQVGEEVVVDELHQRIAGQAPVRPRSRAPAVIASQDTIVGPAVISGLGLQVILRFLEGLEEQQLRERYLSTSSSMISLALPLKRLILPLDGVLCPAGLMQFGINQLGAGIGVEDCP